MEHELPNRPLLVAITVLVAAIFAGDLMVPLAIAGGVLYVVVVLMAVMLAQRYVYVVALVCTALTVIGFLASLDEGTFVTDIANRSLAIFAIWLVAILGIDRKRLSLSVFRLAQVVDQIQDGVITTDMTGRVSYWNRGAEAIFGYTEKAMVGQLVSRLYSSGINELQTEHVIGPLLATGSGVLEITCRSQSGDELLTRQWLMLRRDQSGTPTGVILHVSDITSRREAEKAAERVEVFYQTVLDELPLQVAIFDDQDRFLYLNPASLSDREMREWIIGRTEREYFERVGRNFDVAVERERQRRKAVSEMKAITYEEEFVTKSGELRAYQNGFRPAISQDGHVAKVLGYRYDITDHKAAAWALQESLARLRAILETAGDGIITVDESGAIETFNRAAQHMFGYSFEEATQKHVNDFLFPGVGDDSVGFREGFLVGNDNGASAPIREFGAVRKDGSDFPVEVAVSDVDLEGQHLFTIILRDLTRRKKTERTLTSYTERLEALRQIDQAIRTAQSAKAVAQVAVRHLLQMIPASGARVTLFDDSSDTAMTLSIDVEGTVSGPHNIPLADFHAAANTGDMDDCIEIPLRVQDSEIGALCLATDKPGSFEPEHKSIATEVAGPLAVAIQDARLFEQVDASRERLRALSHNLVQVQEQERRSIARELHDQIGQNLTGLKLLLETLELESGPQVGEYVKEAKEITLRLLARVRDLSLDLRPAMLDDLGLLPALLWLSDRFSKQTGVEIDFRHSGLEPRFDPEIETAAFRIVQEALTNIARHSGSQLATVRVVATDGMLVVTVEDNGAGFVLHDAIDAGESSGLSGMHERAHLLGGNLTIETSPGHGTSLTAEFPVEGNEQHDLTND